MPLYAAVDLGGTKIACALATLDGEIAAQHVIATDSHAGPRAVVERIAATVEELARSCGERPLAVGMGVPGNADLSSGKVLFLPNLPGNWRGVEAGLWLEESLGCPVRLLNDVRMAALGELIYGHGRTTPTFAFFAIGTGIGGGFALDGRLYLNGGGANSEFGHHTVVPDGPRCGCGSQGCLETLCSGPAISAEGVRLLLTGQSPILYEIVQGDAGRVNPATLALAAARGDRAVHEVLLRCSEYLGIAIATVVGLFHPPLVVLGGGVAETGAFDLPTLYRVMQRRVGMFPTDDVRIEFSQLRTDAALLGGVALAAGRGL